MRGLLEGGKRNPAAPPPPEWDEYQLARLFGWTPEQIAAAPAHWCDWALEFAGLEKQRRG